MSDNMNPNTKDIIIIGAGLTGLTTGYYLNKAGRNFVIIEKEPRAGGVINTITENGFTFETGPNTGVLSTPEIASLFEELKDRCNHVTAGQGSNKRYILKNGRWTALPSGPLSAIGTPLFTMKDKFRILGEPFRKPGTNPDETIARLVERRLGQSFLDYAVDPFISGIYAGDPGKLVTRFALPKLYALEQQYGSFIKGAIVKSLQPGTDDSKKVTREVFSVRGGLKNLITALADEIGDEKIIKSCREIVVSPLSGGFKVSVSDNKGITREIFSQAVISTAGGFALPSLFPFIADEHMNKISALNYAGVVQVTAGYNNWNGKKLDAFGGLVPSKEKRDILGILFPSAIFANRAPENGALLSVFIGGVKNPGALNKSDREIEEIALNEIGKTLSTRETPDLLKINRYEHAIPQYDASSGKRLESIRLLQRKYPGLILAGNIRDGIGMADRVKQAKTVAGLFT